MLIALTVPAAIFLIGLTLMMRKEEKCMKRDESAALFPRKRR